MQSLGQPSASQEESRPHFNYIVAPREAGALLQIVLLPLYCYSCSKSKPLSVQGLLAPGRMRIYEWVIRKCNIKESGPRQ